MNSRNIEFLFIIKFLINFLFFPLTGLNSLKPIGNRITKVTRHQNQDYFCFRFVKKSGIPNFYTRFFFFFLGFNETRTIM